MKKSTFLTMQKSVRHLCHTFACFFQAGFFRLFWENKFSKNLVFYLTLLFFFSGQSLVYSQLVGPATVKANFGIEADAYANFLQFGGLAAPPNSPFTDDWFKSDSYPGAGKNVIDQTTAAANKAAILLDNNTTFELRQSIITPSFPFPYPVVTGDGGPYLWLDAVYGRDTNSAQGNQDTSIFSSTSDKNSDNPSTWSLGSGSIPQKDDIIDVMAHLRGTNPHDPTSNSGFPIDDRPFDELWAYAAATLRATNGSKHIDFEFFRTLVSRSTSSLVNTGSDGGRTAWVFDNTGNVQVPGALIISVDYENGGIQPDVRIRLWMSETEFNRLVNNSLTNLKFTAVAGSFEKGEQSGNYGYGRITMKTGEPTSIFSAINRGGTTWGTPWGTLAGEKATYYDDYQEFQHVEIGINLTAFGLDRKGTTDPCANILGSLLVKTRSSAGGQSDSFTSELKDFAGPFQFGFTVKPEVSLTKNNDINCITENATITASGIMPPGSTVKFYGPDPTPNDKEDGIGPEIPGTDLNRVVIVGGVYAAVVSATGFTGCTETSYVTVIEDKTPPSCTITGTDNNFCPGSSGHMYSGPAGLSSYAWSIISGNATIAGSASNQSVSVTAGSTCGEFVLQLVTIGANGCENTCTKTLTISDTEKPVIVPPANYKLAGCNMAWPETVTAPWTDNCGIGGVKSGTVTGVAGTVQTNADGCSQYRDYTFNITDDCTNVAVTKTVRVTRDFDETKPVIVPPADYKLVGCNMAWPETVTAPWTDNCGILGVKSGTVTGVAGTVQTSTDGCSQYRDYTFNITDDCTNAAVTKTVRITRDFDETKPVIVPPADYKLVGCNMAWPTTVTAPWTDNCGILGVKSGTVTGVAGAVQTSTDGCSQYRDYTFNITDDCTNAAVTKTVRITRDYDVTPPVISCSPNKTIECDAEVVFDTPTATDNCNGIPTIVIVSTSIDGLTRTWKATDACGNESTCSQTITVLPCEGCTLGYWKNHTDRWCSTYSPTMLFGNVFVNAPSNLANLTLLQALNLGGGGIFNLARQGVAALLNTCSDEVHYPKPYGSNSQMLIDAVNAAYAAGGNAPGKLATELDILNNTGCPLGGTSASPKGGQSGSSPIINNDNNNPKKEAAGFTAFPVPFKDKLVIKYDFDYVSNVKIEVFNPQGEVVLSKMDENSYLNKEINLHIHSYRGQEQVYLVKLTTDRGSSIKKVMSSK